MKIFPVLKTERLILREKTYEDIPQIVDLAGDPSVSKTTLSIPYPYQKEDAVYWIDNSNEMFGNKSGYDFGIELKDTCKFIGGIGIFIKSFDKAEAGYWIGKPYRNMGYCTEALKEIIRFGFQNLNLNKIFAHHFKENDSSGRVMIKAGMEFEAEMKQHAKKNDRYIDIVQYRITKDEYEKIILRNKFKF